MLFAWYPGQAGGAALADVIFGERSPSGRLPMTFPASIEHLPDFTDYSMVGRGYRYSEHEPLYPFGFGLSYSQVQYESLRLSVPALSSKAVLGGETLTASVTVRNRGAHAVEEVAQAYLSDLEASVRVPNTKLIGFRRVALAAGATATLSFAIDRRALELVDETGQRRLEPGSFRLTVGGAAPGPRAQSLGSPAPALAEFVLQ